MKIKTKWLIPIIALYSVSTLALANLDSIEINGTFTNAEGCRAYAVSCASFEDSDESYNSCRFELYVNGDEVVTLGKAGKIIDTTDNTVTAQDKGWRSTLSFPKLVNVTATFSSLETFNDPMTYPELTVSAFDLTVKTGFLNSKKVVCNNMVLTSEND